jgi:hypothetical protein
MPLAFQSTSHGTVAFGFFNIETHMLLLEDLFFFADRFCRAVATGAEVAQLEAWRVADVGSLHGAIAGVDLTGFIGATYRAFPFPRRREDFKQHPDGDRNEALVRRLIEPFGVRSTISLRRRADGGAAIGEYAFSNGGMTELVAYVVRGGMPRWRDDAPPAYVREMMEADHGWRAPP